MSTFTIMTWNVENLFRAGTEFGPPTEAAYKAKLAKLSQVILMLDPDVLALQEVGSKEAFGDLNGLLEGRYAHAQLSTHPDGRGIRVGFLSKLPILGHEEFFVLPWEGLPRVPGITSTGEATDATTMGRGALRILVRPRADLRLHCITTHLKSKLLSYPAPPNHPRFAPHNENERARIGGFALLRRTAEAVAMRVYANQFLEKNSDQALIMLGDLNDGPDAATTQILYGPGGSEIGTPGFNAPDKGDDSRLFNLALCIDPARRYSRIYNGNKELIDHILVSQELLPGNPRRLPIVDSHIDIEGRLPSINDDPMARRSEPGSDHAPVTARFEM